MLEALAAETPEEFRERLRSLGVHESAWKGGKHYSHCLARFPGDKRAYVGSAREATEKAKRLGLDQNGNVMEVRK